MCVFISVAILAQVFSQTGSRWFLFLLASWMLCMFPSISSTAMTSSSVWAWLTSRSAPHIAWMVTLVARRMALTSPANPTNPASSTITCCLCCAFAWGWGWQGCEWRIREWWRSWRDLFLCMVHAWMPVHVRQIMVLLLISCASPLCFRCVCSDCLNSQGPPLQSLPAALGLALRSPQWLSSMSVGWMHSSKSTCH